MKCIWAEEELDWSERNVEPEMDDALFTNYLQHCVDNHTIQQAFSISQLIYEEYTAQNEVIPPLFRIVPEAVDLWNKCKGPIDNYSRMLKNTKNLTAKLTPIGNIWIHMLHTSLYNAFQAQHLIQNTSFLFDDRCTSWNRFLRHRHNNGIRDGNTMRSFILLLEKTIETEINAYYRAHPNVRRDGDDDEHDEPDINRGRKRRRIKRTEYFVGKRRKLRTDGQDHLHMNYPKQKHCIWCCCVETGKDHYRLGYKTYVGCRKCDVPLCITVREGESKSCFKLFHDATEIYDPCSNHRTLQEAATQEEEEVNNDSSDGDINKKPPYVEEHSNGNDNNDDGDESSVADGDKKPRYVFRRRKGEEDNDDNDDNDDDDESSVDDSDKKPRYVFRRNALRTGANPNIK